MHDGKGNGIEIGGGNQTSDQTNSGIVLAYNVIHNITPGYSNGIYNGIDINYAQNGFATGNQVWAVASQNMTLEGSTGTSTSSTGWTVTGNSFDTTNDTQYNGTACTTYAGCIPMYVYEYSLSGGLTMWRRRSWSTLSIHTSFTTPAPDRTRPTTIRSLNSTRSALTAKFLERTQLLTDRRRPAAPVARAQCRQALVAQSLSAIPIPPRASS